MVSRASTLISQRLVSVGASKRKTDVLSIPSDRAKGQALLQALVIPGNPGAAGFYSVFLEGLHKALDGRMEVIATSQLGHGYDYGRQVFSLDDQIQHKVDVMKEMLLLPGRPPLVVLGHSIGAYMAIKAVQRIEAAAADAQEPAQAIPRIVKVISLFPFLTVDGACFKQRYLRAIVQYPFLVRIFSGFMGCLPMFLQRFAITYWAGAHMGEHALQTAAGLFKPGTAYNAAYLGKTEFRELARPADWQLVKSFGTRIAIFCCPMDFWFPLWQYEEMLAEVPQVEAYMIKSQQHDFCVSVALSYMMAEKVAGLLQQSLQQ